MANIVLKNGGRHISTSAKNNNPRRGLTMRMMLQANLKVKIPLTNIKTMRIRSSKDIWTLLKGKKYFGYVYRVRDSVVTTPRIPPPPPPLTHECHILRVDGQEGKLSDRNVNVIVTCDCEAFMYMSEYALAHYGASFIKHSNGKPPDSTNPGLIPFTCKHLHVSFLNLIEKGQ